MTTTPQPIQQQAFSFTPPGTFSQGFGFVPTRLRIDNPSSYYLSFPKIPSFGIITPYTFGAVVPWSQSDATVTITSDYTPPNAPALPLSNAQITILASTNQELAIQPGINIYSSGTPPVAGPVISTTYGANAIQETFFPPANALSMLIAWQDNAPGMPSGEYLDYTLTDVFSGAIFINSQAYESSTTGSLRYIFLSASTMLNGVSLDAALSGGGTFTATTEIAQIFWYLSGIFRPITGKESPLFVGGANGWYYGGNDMTVLGLYASTPPNQSIDQIVASGLIPPVWSSTTSYIAGDTVVYDGIIYVAYINPPTGTLPTNTSYWIQMTASYVIAG